jgi:molybdenum cofactor cytidylyltransferase
MKFGAVSLAEAIGALAAHSIRAGDVIIRKGHRISEEDAGRLAAAGLDAVTVVQLEAGDIGEDEAAQKLADAFAGDNVDVERPFTGRSNLFASRAGILKIRRETIDVVNRVDEAITVATLPAFRAVVAGEMIGTVKIIPYAIPEILLDEAVRRAGKEAISVAPYRLRRVGVVSTLTPSLKASVVDKTLQVLQRRLDPAGAAISAEARVKHEVQDLRAALSSPAMHDAELIVVFGASAIADRRDVIPQAIEAAGGRVEHFGMPVDPGNLLLVGSCGNVPVIGAPGCARSPKENGFDWMLQRLLAGLPISREDITGLGVGGLLMEIVSRPQPRAGGESKPE